jgi:hypothetical protein
VGVATVGGIFVHKGKDRRSREKSTTLILGTAMKESLPPAQEAQAQELAAAIAEAARDDLLQIARDLIASDDASLFGETEFRVRDAVLRVAAKAYEERLAQKKTATRGPA